MNDKMKATRDGFAEGLLGQARRSEDIVVVSCDLPEATRTKEFSRQFPERFFEIGIAEQNGIGIAAGLAMGGLRPFICSFGAFITGRYDQIRISAAYSGAPLVVVGTHAGLAIGKDGATQMGIEDLNVMAALPALEIYQPADALEAKQITEYLCQNKKLAYLRLSRRPQPSVHSEDYVFDPHRAEALKKGKDVAVFATGDMVHHALIAAQQLEKERLSVDVINFPMIKPIDTHTVKDYLEKRKGIVTVEDHSIIGGLGSRVCEVAAELGSCARVYRHGIRDRWGESGAPEDLYKKHRLDIQGISEVLKEFSAQI